MYKRFEEFLNNEFKGLPKTKEVKDFRDELLGTLIERAEDYKNDGIGDEDKIYDMCIKSINGFKGILKELRGKPLLIKEAKKAANNFLYFVIYFVIVAVAYLAVSFTLGHWDKTWLIFIATNFIALIILLAYLATKNYSKGKFILGRTLIIPIPILLIVGTYLVLSVLFNAWNRSWILLLTLPVLVLLTDIIAASFGDKNKFFVFELIAVIMILSVVAYVSLALFSIIAWHPYWLIVLGGVVISSIILAVFLRLKTK